MNDGDADPIDWSQFYQNIAASGRRDPPRQLTMDAASAGGSRGKPAGRKRSRTSRRAPTTLLNTDTSNFRAMVQQFTGAPSVPYTTTASYIPAGSTATLNFGFGFNNPASSQSAINLPSYMNIAQHSQYRHALPQQQEMIGFGIGENVEDDRRHQGMESSREIGLGLPEEFFLDGIGGQPSENNRGGGYFL